MESGHIDRKRHRLRPQFALRVVPGRERADRDLNILYTAFYSRAFDLRQLGFVRGSQRIDHFLGIVPEHATDVLRFRAILHERPIELDDLRRCRL